ncbi:17603_t:CDS:1, partial [Racocetra persica]
MEDNKEKTPEEKKETEEKILLIDSIKNTINKKTEKINELKAENKELKNQIKRLQEETKKLQTNNFLKNI